MKKTLSLLLAAAFITLSAPIASAQEYTVYDRYTYMGVVMDVNMGKDGLKISGDATVKVQNGEISPFTGFAKTKKGTYCYKDGIKWLGWYKKGGKWYYFDPENDGLMSVKTAKTPVGTYYLDENGAWNGKLSKSAKMPKDFGYTYQFGGGESTEYYLNTSEGVLRRDNYCEGVDAEKEIKISVSDMQIIYDTFKASGAESFDAETIISAIDIEAEYALDMPSYSVSWTLNGNMSDTFCNSSVLSYAYYSRSEEIRKLTRLFRFTDMYMQSRPEYHEIIAEENEYFKAHKYDEVPFNELTEVKTKASDIYKFKGFHSLSGGRTRLITSKAEMNELIAMLRRENVSENSKLIKRLSSYDEKYFEKNAVVFGDCTGSSGSLEFDDPKLYTGYSNIYLSVTARYPETYTCDLCYAAAVAEASKEQLGCENTKPPVIWRYETVYEHPEF